MVIMKNTTFERGISILVTPGLLLGVLIFLWTLHNDIGGLHRDIGGLAERVAKIEGYLEGIQAIAISPPPDLIDSPAPPSENSG